SRHFVAAFGNSVLLLEKPLLSSFPAQQCNANTSLTIKILNLPDPSKIFASVKLDNNPLTINTDSTFTINPSSLSPGSHRIQVSFNIGAYMMDTITDINVIAAVTPDVNLSASTTIVTTPNPVTITATNASGGGASPLYTFAKDYSMNTILQAESGNNILILNPANLVTGNNWIYCRMRTSDLCTTAQTNIDSINIVLSAVTGIRDIDYPDQVINVFPNPFERSVTVKGLQTSKSYTIFLANSIGQNLLAKNVQHVTTVNIDQNLPPGIYWLSVYDNTKGRSLGVVKLVNNSR
ncbi:MAG TPA: T9SS type A sorting domain-containing protein, partial [Chitinophagaceae bacterium]